MYINTVNPSTTDTADVQQFIVHRDAPSVAQPDAVSLKNNINIILKIAYEKTQPSH